MDVLEEDKKSLKKWLTAKRNKRDWGINRHVQQINEEQQRQRDLEEAQAVHAARADSTGHEDKPWMAKTREVRSRLDDKKRDSAERWNRFAGTEGGGGRGL